MAFVRQVPTPASDSTFRADVVITTMIAGRLQSSVLDTSSRVHRDVVGSS